jgi:GNAT superfamily N-acetyltransferase
MTIKIEAASRLLAASRLRRSLLIAKAPKYYVLKNSDEIILTLVPIELKDLKKAYRSIPIVRILPRFVWDEGTEDAEEFPTLDWIAVPKKYQGKGIARQLVAAVFDYMTKKKIKAMMFNDYSGGFWKGLDDPRVSFPKKYKGRIGLLTA